MLFSYQYVPHKMEKMQGFIDFIFFEVWCKASRNKPFSLELFEHNTELYEVMQDFYFTCAPKEKPEPTAVKFYNQVQEIYISFSNLKPTQINKFKKWYKANNNIEKVCVNNPAFKVVRYADIETAYPELSKQLFSFFKGLYSQQLLGLSALREKVGEIDDHYHEFVKVNNLGKCPFCGISKMHGQYNTKREAYDHYLPKGLYPFNSINFHNLAPACQHCNSRYKLSQDPAFTPKDPVRKRSRRKVFYPYSTSNYKIEITIDLSKPNIDNLNPSNIQLTFGPSAIKEEIESWKDIYSIEERFKAECCYPHGGKYWLEELRIQCDNYNIETDVALATVQQVSENNPFAESNFLKVAFLEGCHRIGMWKSNSAR
jgi:hypothetical protein